MLEQGGEAQWAFDPEPLRFRLVSQHQTHGWKRRFLSNVGPDHDPFVGGDGLCARNCAGVTPTALRKARVKFACDEKPAANAISPI
jgi:hypothetical protein